MKIVQVFSDCVIAHLTEYPTLEEARKHYASYVQLMEAPDDVFVNWMYVDGKFVPPSVPEGQLLDLKTGTVSIPAYTQHEARKKLYMEYDGDEMRCLRNIRLKKDVETNTKILTQIDNYKEAVSNTVNDPLYPLNPTYPPKIIFYPEPSANYLKGSTDTGMI